MHKSMSTPVIATHSQKRQLKKLLPEKFLLGVTVVFQAQCAVHLLSVFALPVQAVHKCLSVLCVQHVAPG